MFEIRSSRAAQGPKKLEAERAEYFRLVDQGVSSAEACRIVGVNKQTGIRWRRGLPRLPAGGRRGPRRSVSCPMAPGGPGRRALAGPGAPASGVSTRFLSADERVVIADLRLKGAPIRAIAATLGRSPSTI